MELLPDALAVMTDFPMTIPLHFHKCNTSAKISPMSERRVSI